jgi:hypothetical protein
MSHADFISKMIESESRVDATGLVRHNDFGESRHGTNYAEQVAAALQLAAAAKFESRSRQRQNCRRCSSCKLEGKSSNATDLSPPSWWPNVANNHRPSSRAHAHSIWVRL